MNTWRTHRLFLAIVLAAATAVTSLAQTTGGVVGVVSDESGAVLAGVTAEARSPSLQGLRVAATDATGSYHFRLLPPGEYALTFTLQGYATETKKEVVVSLGRDTTVDVVMHPSFAEQVVVSGEAPTVDTTSTTLGTNLTSRAIEALPTGRNYTSVVQVTPGIVKEANPQDPNRDSISIYGSSGAENAYIIDGVNTTNLEYGFQGKDLNYEFIQEIDVKTGGYEAEYGRSTGGIINVITKSGGNDYHGDAFGYYDKDSWQRSAKPVISITGTPSGYTKDDYGLDLGGYFIKDGLWFFAAYDRVKNVNKTLPAPPADTHVVESTDTGNLGSAKLTLRLAENQSLIATLFRDPRVTTGAINDANHSVYGDPLTYQGRYDRGGNDYALRYEGIFGSEWTTAAQVSRHDETNDVGPATAEGDVPQYLDSERGFYQTGGFGRIEQKAFKRTMGSVSVTRFLADHELKGGLEYEKDDADVMKRMSGGQLVTVIKNLNPAHADMPIYSHYYWTTRDATVDDQGRPVYAPLSALFSTTQHKVTTAYLQDKWMPSPRLTIDLGVRWDRQQVFDTDGSRRIDLKHDYAPRLGFIWDPKGDHKSKVFGSYGRFYEEIPMDLVIRSYSYELQPTVINYSPTDINFDLDAEADYIAQNGFRSRIYGAPVEPTDPNLHGQYVTELILGGEKEVMADLAIGVKGIYRDYGNIIEDFLCNPDNGAYCIGNPGKGIMERIYTLDYSTTYPAPRPVRIFRGLQIDVTKRFSNNWQMIASYLLSKLEGNYDGEYAPFTNIGPDPNISAAYDYYDFFTNGSDLSRITNRGPLSNDRRHQFKVSGVYFTPWKLTIGLSAYYRTGTPLTRYGYSDAYSRYEYFLTRRGSEGRTPDNYDLDLHLGYPVPIGPASVNFLLDVFNVLNTQKPVLLDERWGFATHDNSSPTPVNLNYGKPVLRTPPTSVRLGVRVSL